MLLDTPSGDKDQLLRERYHTFVATNRIPESLRRRLTQDQLQSISTVFQSSTGHHDTRPASKLRIKSSRNYQKHQVRQRQAKPAEQIVQDSKKRPVTLIGFTQQFNVPCTSPERTLYNVKPRGFTNEAADSVDIKTPTDDSQSTFVGSNMYSDTSDLDSLVIMSADYKGRRDNTSIKRKSSKDIRQCRRATIIYKLPPMLKPPEEWGSTGSVLSKIVVDSNRCTLMKPKTKEPPILYRHHSSPAPIHHQEVNVPGRLSRARTQIKSSDLINLRKRQTLEQHICSKSHTEEKIINTVRASVDFTANTFPPINNFSQEHVTHVTKHDPTTTDIQTYYHDKVTVEEDEDAVRRKPVLPSSTNLTQLVRSASNAMNRAASNRIVINDEYDSFARRKH